MSIRSTSGLGTQERRHRRRLMAGLTLLIALAAAPLVAHHVPIGLTESLAGRNHLWALCLVALHVVLAPVHGVFHVLIGAGVSYAMFDRIRAVVRARKTLAALPWHAPTEGTPMHRAARRARVDPGRLRIVPGLADPAFTAGVMYPRIYVAADLPARLSPRELTAVLVHERAHVSRRDPLRVSGLRFIACSLFWIPAMRRLAEDLRNEIEIAADDAAAEDAMGLASALLSLASASTASAAHLAGGVGFRRDDLLDRRVRRLAGAAAGPRSSVTYGAALLSAAILFLGFAAAATVAHPLSGDHPAADAHCEDHGAMALFHLFCGTRTGSGDDCPHSRPAG